jgi:hypothetical protein
LLLLQVECQFHECRNLFYLVPWQIPQHLE